MGNLVRHRNYADAAMLMVSARPLSSLNDFVKNLENLSRRFLQRCGTRSPQRHFVDARGDHRAARLLSGSYKAGFTLEAVLLCEADDAVLYNDHPHIYPAAHPDLIIVYMGIYHEDFAQQFGELGEVSSPSCFIDEFV